MPNKLPKYVLVTPARNEAAFIEKTITSVIEQTVLPVKWVIVSDGSTDGTDEIVQRFASQHFWIELVRQPERRERNFAGKVAAFNAGLQRLRNLDFEVVGNVDADVSFEADYFAFLLEKLATDAKSKKQYSLWLVLEGTPYRDPLNPPYDYRFASIEHVTGPCQVFRRSCFEAIGGYRPVRGGCIDRIADISARMKGWRTRTFTEKTYLHYRYTGTAEQGVLTAKFKDGGKDYSVGTSPIWEVFRSCYQMTKKPLIIGGVVTALGYFWAAVRRMERPVPRELVEFCRREQMQRLKQFTGRMLRPNS